MTGRIPAELTGRYLRNGPNALGIEDPATHHWMLGEGIVHGVRLRDGRAEWYRNRWVRSGPVPDRININVIGHAGRTLALQEGGAPPYELGYELDTIGACGFNGTLQGSFTAHTKLDPRTGELHAIAYAVGVGYVQYLVVDAAGSVIHTTNIPVPDSPMMHDVALIQKYVIVLDQPVTFSMDAINTGAKVPYIWNREHQARVGVLSTLDWTLPGGLVDGLLAVLAAGASLVQCSNVDPTKLAARRSGERVTTTLGDVAR